MVDHGGSCGGGKGFVDELIGCGDMTEKEESRSPIFMT